MRDKERDRLVWKLNKESSYWLHDVFTDNLGKHFLGLDAVFTGRVTADNAEAVSALLERFGDELAQLLGGNAQEDK